MEKGNSLSGDMPIEEFRKSGHTLVDWIANYLENINNTDVFSNPNPGDLKNKISSNAPIKGEPMDVILGDIDKIIMPGMTHWNHPNFMAYFNSTASGPGILGEFLAAAFNINGMVWKSCPSSTELEEVTLDWFREMLKLPDKFWGIVYDTASVSSFHAIVAAREYAKSIYSDYDLSKLVIYISEETHSSIAKGAKAAGISDAQVRKVSVDEKLSMIPQELTRLIAEDLKQGLQPFCVVATVGTTSTTSIDPVEEISAISQQHELWLHVDAAHAGSAAIVPELRPFMNGSENAYSIVVNPHKWLFVPIDFSILYTSKREILRNAFSLIPEYLRTEHDDEAVNFMDYGIQLGRRFRSLKFWFVLRYFGTEGLSNIIREHLRLGKMFSEWIDQDENFERLAPVPFSTICFRAKPVNMNEEILTNKFNERLLNEILMTRKLFLSHTKIKGMFSIRLVISGIRTKEEHIRNAWNLIKEKFDDLKDEF